MTAEEIAARFPTLEKELIGELLHAGRFKTLQKGEVLVRTGQYMRSAILIFEGLLKIYREDEEGNEFFMYYLDAGKVCAVSLVCMLGGTTSSLAATAMTETTVIEVPVDYVNEWMGKYKSWAQFAVSSYRERFDELLQAIDHIAFRNMDERLVFYLKRHQQQTGSNTISLSNTDIARDLNSSREVISRLMKRLSERGLVALHRNHVEIINLDKALA